jgi:hypothetical protein
MNIKCVFEFSLHLLAETFLSRRRIERDMIKKCILVTMQNTRYSRQILMKPELSGQIFEKYSNTKVHEIPSSTSPVVL